VLLILPHDRRRDAVRKAFQNKDAAEFRTDLWRFVARTDIKLDTLFNKAICYRCDEQPPELLVGAAGVRAGARMPGAADGPQGRESPNARGPDVEPAALLAGLVPAVEVTEERGLSSAEIRTNTDADTRD